MDPLSIALGLLIPALVAGGALLCARFLPGRKALAARGLLTLSVTLGYCAGHAAIRGLPSFPPSEATDWIFWLALLAGLAGLLESFRPGASAVVVGRRLLLSGAVPFITLRSQILHVWNGREAVLWIGGLGLGIFLHWTLLGALQRRRPGDRLCAGLSVALLAAGAAIFLSGNLVVARLAAALGAALGAATAALFFRKDDALGIGSLAPVPIILWACLINAVFLGELSRTSAFLLALAALGDGITELPLANRLTGRSGAALRLAAILLPAVGAVAIPLIASLASASGE